LSDSGESFAVTLLPASPLGCDGATGHIHTETTRIHGSIFHQPTLNSNTIFLSSSHPPCRNVTNSLKQNSLSHFYSLREMPPTSLIAHLPSLNTLQYRTFKFETIRARLSRTCLTGTSYRDCPGTQEGATFLIVRDTLAGSLQPLRRLRGANEALYYSNIISHQHHGSPVQSCPLHLCFLYNTMLSRFIA